jgi:prenylcysteine oxidase/farnesylcysteine lyase
MTRVNYASNLANIHGLDTMVATAPEGAMSIAGGNWQIFDRMVKASGARVLRNTSVTQVAKDPSLRPRPYHVTTSNSHDSAGQDPGLASFDDVVIATPYQFSNMRIPSIDPVIDKIPYVQLHVTIFASPHRLSAAYFKVPPSEVPTMVLTTLPEGADPNSGLEGAGKSGFFSISTLRTLIHPKTGREEYLYKVFSPTSVTPGFLRLVCCIPFCTRHLITFVQRYPRCQASGYL